MNSPPMLDANEHPEHNAALFPATPACNFLSGWAGRGLRVGNPCNHAEHQREKKLVVRYALKNRLPAYGVRTKP